MKNKLFKIVLLVASSLVLFSCSKPAKTADVERKEISIGFSPGPYADLFRAVIQPQLEKKGYKIKIVEFTDWVTPNLALANNEIDANIYQNTLYRQNF